MGHIKKGKQTPKGNGTGSLQGQHCWRASRQWPRRGGPEGNPNPQGVLTPTQVASHSLFHIIMAADAEDELDQDSKN